MARNKTRSKTRSKAGAAPKTEVESAADVDSGIESAAALEAGSDSVAEVNPAVENDAPTETPAKTEADAQGKSLPDGEAKADADATSDVAPDSTDEGEPESANEATSDAEVENTPDLDPEAEGATVLDAESDSAPEMDLEPENDTGPDAEFDSIPEVAPEAEAESYGEPDAGAESAPELVLEPELALEPEVSAALDTESEGIPEADPEPDNDIAPDASLESAPDLDTESETLVALNAEADEISEPEPEPEPEIDIAPDVVSDSAPVAKTGSKPGSLTGAALAALVGRPPAATRSFGAPTGSGQKSDRKVALITGASGGIGEAFARKLATDGYALVLVARSDSELNRVAGLVTAEHDLPVATVPIDLTSPDAAAEIEFEFEKRNITPEIVINNAGFGLNGPVADLDRQRQIEMIDLNIRMLTDLSMRFIPAMRERGRGGIINIASTAAYLPGPYMAIYYASKAYVLSFSEALATELKGTGITVTTVCPGPTATGFQEAAGMTKAAVVKLFPMMSAEEVVEVGYQGFRSGKRVVIPGLMNRITAATAPMISNRILLPIMRLLQGPRS